jgi:hypothetical protein
MYEERKVRHRYGEFNDLIRMLASSISLVTSAQKRHIVLLEWMGGKIGNADGEAGMRISLK